jgi:hypothetical protein
MGTKYVVAIGSLRVDLTFEDEQIVIGDPLNQKTTCACGMFERTWILFGHGLGVIEFDEHKNISNTLCLEKMDLGST